MREVVLVALLGACSFSKGLAGDDEPGDIVTLTDSELAGVARDGVVAGGNVEPDGFVVGGLHARAFQATLVDDNEDIAKVLADAMSATETGAGYAQVPMDWTGNSRPRGLGLVNDSNWTVIYKGEILLPQGEVTLEVDVDDRGVVETLGKRVSNDGTATLVVPEAGWYPIDAALTQAGGNSKMVLTLVQGQVRTVVDGARLRARVTAEPGVAVFVFEQERFVSPRGQIARRTIAESYSVSTPPFDLDTSFDHFSLRFAGQLRIDTAGTYMFDATIDTTDDNWRLWIDGNVVANKWLGLPDVPVGSVDLAPGWHSILVDYNEGIGDAQIAVHMTGPDAPNGGTIDPARLRPVVVHGNTYTFTATAATEIKDLMSTFVTLPLPGGPTELIDSVDYAFRIENQLMSTLQVTLFDCTAGKLLTLGAAPAYFYYPGDKTCAGSVTHPPIDWQLRLADTAAGNPPFVGNGRILDYGLTALYHGGPNIPFAPVFAYTSEPKPTPGAKRIAAVRALGALADTAIEIAVRAADDAAALEGQPFEVIREGEKIEAAGDFVQYRVTISTNGWISPVLDAVEIDYVVE